MSLVLRNEAEARFPYLLKDGHDHKAWAKRILYRFDRGAKDLLPVQISFAQMAMGIEPKQGE